VYGIHVVAGNSVDGGIGGGTVFETRPSEARAVGAWAVRSAAACPAFALLSSLGLIKQSRASKRFH
jgi:hypothetical protein